MRKSSIPPASTPMCEAARAIPELKVRIRHYHDCPDPRCQERSRVARGLAKAIAEGQKRPKPKAPRRPSEAETTCRGCGIALDPWEDGYGTESGTCQVCSCREAP